MTDDAGKINLFQGGQRREMVGNSAVQRSDKNKGRNIGRRASQKSCLQARQRDGPGCIIELTGAFGIGNVIGADIDGEGSGVERAGTDDVGQKLSG